MAQWNEVSEVHPGHFLAYLKEGRSAVTLSSYMTALSQFAEFSHDENLLANGTYVLFRSRLKRVQGRVPARKIPTVPTEESFQAILTEVHKDHGGTIRQNLMRLRDIAVLETLRSTGCRVAEVVSLCRRDLRNGTALITGKGKKMRMIFFDDAAQDAIETYLALRGDTDPGNPVFARHDRRAQGAMPLSTTSVRNIIDRLAIAAGLDPGSVSPHKFRHRFGARVLSSTGDLSGLQDLLGHASPVTTRLYSRLTSSHLADLHGSVAL
jgi:site-specific recombinase XerD